MTGTAKIKVRAGRVVGAAVGVCLLLAALAWAWRGWRRGGPAIPARTEEPGPTFCLPVVPIYLQTDRRWAGERVGGSGETLRAVGCTVCCLSMALAQHGVDLRPGELNEKLRAADGYTQSGRVIWSAITAVTGGKVEADVPRHPTHARINAALDAGNPVIAKVRLAGGTAHWVLVVGREGREYLVKDPLGDGLDLDKLSKFGSVRRGSG